MQCCDLFGQRQKAEEDVARRFSLVRPNVARGSRMFETCLGAGTNLDTSKNQPQTVLACGRSFRSPEMKIPQNETCTPLLHSHHGNSSEKS